MIKNLYVSNLGMVRLSINFDAKSDLLKLTRIYLPGLTTNNYTAESESEKDDNVLAITIQSRKIGRFLKTIKKYLDMLLAGKNPKINFAILDLSALTAFQRKILICLYVNIAFGKTISYSKLGELAGYLNSARAVGNVMAANPFPIIFPCHRVIRKDSGIGKFQGSTDLKKKLLRLESKISNAKRKKI